MHKAKETIREVIFAMLPVVLVVIIMQFSILHLPEEVMWRFLGGAVMVGGGLFLFLLGVQVGMLPMGELIGSAIARQGKLWLLIVFGFILGFVVTVAEPDVRVLALQVDLVSSGAISRSVLVYTIALGLGVFVSFAMLRIIFNIPLVYLLIMTIHFAQEHFPNEQMFGIIETNIGSEAIPHGKPRHYYPL
jgi:hypothetical protein